MRQLSALFLILALWVFPARAQSTDPIAYEVRDVAVDVTAANAAKARDQGVVAAQRLAFTQLLDRFGLDPAIASKLSDDDIATLVQNFEVQNERASAVRYIGTFTVQFRPLAVRTYLSSIGANYSDVRGAPVLVVPVYTVDSHSILWETPTRWRAAWDKASHDDGMVPVILAAGNLDDIAMLSTQEAIEGDNNAIHALVDKYQAGGGAVIAKFEGDVDKFANGFALEMQHYDAQGNALASEHLTYPPPADKNGVDAILAQAEKDVRHQLEKDRNQGGNMAASSGGEPPVGVPVPTPGATTHLPVTVPIATLAEWNQIRGRITSTSGVDNIAVITLQRGEASIEIEFHGNIADLQTALLQENLRLSQNTLSELWTLQRF